MRCLSCFALQSLLILVVGCEGQPLFDGPSPVRVEVSVDSATLRWYDVLHLEVAVTNTTGGWIETEAYLDPISFEVLDARGARVGEPPSPLFPASSPRRKRLAPHATLVTEFTWGPESSYRGTAPPGAYEVIGLFRGAEQVRSEPVPIQIVPTIGFAAKLGAERVAVGEPVEIIARVTNVDDRAARPPAFSTCALRVWIMSGERALEFLSECGAGEFEMELAPGATAETSLSWRPETPGSYRAHVEYHWEKQPGLAVVLPLTGQ